MRIHPQLSPHYSGLSKEQEPLHSGRCGQETLLKKRYRTNIHQDTQEPWQEAQYSKALSIATTAAMWSSPHDTLSTCMRCSPSSKVTVLRPVPLLPACVHLESESDCCRAILPGNTVRSEIQAFTLRTRLKRLHDVAAGRMRAGCRDREVGAETRHGPAKIQNVLVGQVLRHTMNVPHEEQCFCTLQQDAQIQGAISLLRANST